MDDIGRATRLLGLIAGRHASQGDGPGRLEGSSPEGDGLAAARSLPPASVVVDALACALDAVPADEVADAGAFARARELLLSRAADALYKARRDGPTAAFDPDDVGSFEAVVMLDGTRPSLMLRDGGVPSDHPFLGAWRDDVLAFRDVISAVSASVGRIEPDGGSAGRYWGTGFVVDDARGVVMTCRHVMRDLIGAVRPTGASDDGTFDLPPGACVDFAGELGSARRERFRVVAARAVGAGEPAAAGAPALDAAVLRIEPLGEGGRDAGPTDFPPAVGLTFDPAGPLGRAHSVAVIGFPGDVPPAWARRAGEAGVDWAWVADALMGGRRGVKRLAPGLVSRPLATSGGERTRFGHDATTLGGSSGSPVLLWRDRGGPACGIHVAGRTLDSNRAHALCAMRGEVAHAVARV